MYTNTLVHKYVLMNMLEIGSWNSHDEIQVKSSQDEYKDEISYKKWTYWLKIKM